MPSTEDVLAEQTHKQEGVETAKRAFYTIHPSEQPAAALHRTAKLLGLLIENLENRGVLSEEDIDALLLDSIT